MKHMSAAAACLLAFSVIGQDVRNQLVTYPDYPADITRDFAYRVEVTQGPVKKPLTVYNHCEKSVLSSRTRGGDVNRRFCEFGFSGDPVRVDVSFVEDVRSYKVFPARLNLKSSFKDGVLSIWVDRPSRFGIQINDYDKSILSIFADRPEDESAVPQRDTPGVLFVDGWMDAPNPDGVIETDGKIREIYLAPGSVLNARLRVRGKGTRIHGRGIILDPLSDIFRYDQTRNSRRGLVSLTGNCTIEGVKLVDARTFNICAWGDDVTIRNVKVLSSMMCSDGFTNGGRRLLAEDSWLYVGDNALVVSGVRDSVYRNIAIGTSCAAVFPQSSNSNVTLRAVDAFRADDGLINNFHNGVLRRNNKWDEMNGSLQKKEPGPQDLKHQFQDFRFVDLSAVDCTLFSHFFSGRNMGALAKTFLFDGLALPHSTGSSDYRSIGRRGGATLVVRNDPKKWLMTDNYVFSFTDLWIGGERGKFAESEIVGGDKMRISYAETGKERSLPPRADRHDVGWTCPFKVYRGEALVRDWRLTDRDSGERRLDVADWDANLVKETLPRQSVWQRVPSWSVKLMTENGTCEDRRTYDLVQCERGAGMQAVVTEAVVARGAGRYRLSFDARVDCGESKNGGVRLVCRVTSNEWKVEKPFDATKEWSRGEIDFDLRFEARETDLVSVYIGTTQPTDRIQLKKLCFRQVNQT